MAALALHDHCSTLVRTEWPTATVLAQAQPAPGLVMDLILEVVPSRLWHPRSLTSPSQVTLVLALFAHEPGPCTLFRTRLPVSRPTTATTLAHLHQVMLHMQAVALLDTAGSDWLHTAHHAALKATHTPHAAPALSFHAIAAPAQLPKAQQALLLLVVLFCSAMAACNPGCASWIRLG